MITMDAYFIRLISRKEHAVLSWGNIWFGGRLVLGCELHAAVRLILSPMEPGPPLKHFHLIHFDLSFPSI